MLPQLPATTTAGHHNPREWMSLCMTQSAACSSPCMGCVHGPHVRIAMIKLLHSASGSAVVLIAFRHAPRILPAPVEQCQAASSSSDHHSHHITSAPSHPALHETACLWSSSTVAAGARAVIVAKLEGCVQGVLCSRALRGCLPEGIHQGWHLALWGPAQQRLSLPASQVGVSSRPAVATTSKSIRGAELARSEFLALHAC